MPSSKQPSQNDLVTGTTRREFAAVLGAGAAAAMVGPAQGAPKADDSPAPARSGLSELYTRSDAMDLAELVRRREISASELLEEAIRQVEQLNPPLNAVVQKHYDMARSEVAKGLISGPLAGVPFLLKDLGVRLSGTVTTGASKSLLEMESPIDSELVSRYKAAGLVVFGKTNTPEFGMALTTESELYGACRNPWNLAYSTGGSSGGSAAAVAAGMVPAAHASDGGGSIRVPAAACGVFGFKPTRLLNPRGPGGALSPSAMSVHHVVSRSVRDSALLLDLTGGYEPGAPVASPAPAGGHLEAAMRTPEKLRIALCLTEPAVALDAECRRAVEEAGRLLESAGHVVEEAVTGVDFDSLNDAQIILMQGEFAHGMQSLASAKKVSLARLGLEPLSLEFVREGLAYSAGEYLAALQETYRQAEKMAVFQKSFDLLLKPVTATPAPELGTINAQLQDTPFGFVSRFRKYAAYTHFYNLTGQPAASIPMGQNAQGLPLAAMLVGRTGEDRLLFSACAQLETARPWFNDRPPVNRV